MILMASSISMGRLEKKSFSKPDEVQTPKPGTRVEIVRIGGKEVSKFTWMPGWSWSKDVKPTVNTQSCQVHHFGYVESGRLLVTADDGTEIEYGPGDMADIPPGHKGQVVGNKPVIFYEYGSLLKKE